MVIQLSTRGTVECSAEATTCRMVFERLYNRIYARNEDGCPLTRVSIASACTI